MAAALGLGVAALLRQGRKARKENRAESKEERVKVTLRPDEDKLFRAIDAQMQAIDRYMNDFAYLNEQAEDKQSAPDGKTLALVADMLEALYECDGESIQSAEEATRRMLAGLGLDAIHYGPDTQHLFTILPSKTETRTMVPAIVTEADARLLKRGTAAVKMAAEEL